MTKKEILNAFLQAEKDWSEPITKAIKTHTHWGLCSYFWIIQDIDSDIQKKHLKPLWGKYRTEFETLFHFWSYGDDPKGRAERLDAIRKVINDLKTES